MLSISTRLLSRPALAPTRRGRFYSEAVSSDLRTRLMSEVKAAMKNRDSFTSTALRSVLSEVYTADKVANEKVSQSTMTSILRKAVTRRTESAAQFIQASRPELADKEAREAEILSKLLPPLLPEVEIESQLQEAIDALPAGADSRQALGLVFKNFYSKVDKSLVDSDLVKKKAQAMFANRS